MRLASASDGVTVHRFDVPVGGTTIASVIVLTVISEDEEEREIEININRGDGPTTPPATLTDLTLTGVTLSLCQCQDNVHGQCGQRRRLDNRRRDHRPPTPRP